MDKQEEDDGDDLCAFEAVRDERGVSVRLVPDGLHVAEP